VIVAKVAVDKNRGTKSSEPTTDAGDSQPTLCHFSEATEWEKYFQNRTVTKAKYISTIAAS